MLWRFGALVDEFGEEECLAGTRQLSGGLPIRPSGPALDTYVVRWYRYLVGGTFLVLGVLFVVGALPVVRSQPGAAAFLFVLALLLGGAGVNGLTLGRLTVYADGLVFGRGVFLRSRWTPRARIDEVCLARGSSAISAPFLIPVVRCTDGTTHRFQSLRGLYRAGRVSVPERIVQELQQWLVQQAPT